jgi:hypothetical protein
MRMPRWGWFGAPAAALAFAFAFAPGAAASDDPQVDPGSPAGTEYQLPVDRAREQAGSGSNGGSGKKAGSSGASPLFGEGVKPKASGSTKPSGSDSGSATTTTTPERRPQLGKSTPEIVRSQADAPDGGGGGLLAIGAGAAGVLLIGGAAGLIWRRRSVRG